MTQIATSPLMTDLPDPVHQPEFYDNVPPKRFFAWIVDSILTMALVLIAIPFTAFVGVFMLPLLYFVIGFAYRVITLTGGSATLGMRLFAIEIRNAHGRRLDLSTAFLHTLGYTISLSFALVQVISMVLMMTTERGQGLSDMVLGTVAINRRR